MTEIIERLDRLIKSTILVSLVEVRRQIAAVEEELTGYQRKMDVGNDLHTELRAELEDLLRNLAEEGESLE